MKCYLAIFICGFILCASADENTENQHTGDGVMSNTLLARLMSKRQFYHQCGKYRDPCNNFLPCCRSMGYDCDYSNSPLYDMGKCIKDWK